jgi:hypothetical protein
LNLCRLPLEAQISFSMITQQIFSLVQALEVPRVKAEHAYDETRFPVGYVSVFAGEVVSIEAIKRIELSTSDYTVSRPLHTHKIRKD